MSMIRFPLLLRVFRAGEDHPVGAGYAGGIELVGIGVDLAAEGVVKGFGFL